MATLGQTPIDPEEFYVYEDKEDSYRNKPVDIDDELLYNESQESDELED